MLSSCSLRNHLMEIKQIILLCILTFILRDVSTSFSGWLRHPSSHEFPKVKTSQRASIPIPNNFIFHPKSPNCATRERKTSGEKPLKTGAENSIREEQINSLHWGFKVKNSIDNFCINHRFWQEAEIIFSLEGLRH